MQNKMVVGAEDVVIEATLILQITVGHMECVPIQEKNAGPRKKNTRKTRCGATIFQEVKKLHLTCRVDNC